jgi:hypothetical protein
MATLALELNDAGIIAVRDDHPDVLALPESPGYAIVENGHIVTGHAAASRARLKPRFTHTRFWDELSTTPLASPFPSRLSRADLAYSHLKELWERLHRGVERTVVAVSGFYSLEQLGLILGMTGSVGMSVEGLIDSALAAASDVREPRASSMVYFDLHLHRAVASRLVRNRRLTRDSIVTSDRVGAIALRDAWASLIARSFVRQTRFDPLHTAEAEQSLYDALAGWVGSLVDAPVVTIAMDSGGKRHEVELARDDVIRCAQPYYEAIVALAAASMEGEDTPGLLLSHRLASLPGLTAHLSRDVAAELVELPLTAPATGALSLQPRIPPSRAEDGVTFLTSLSLETGAEDPRPQLTSTEREPEREPEAHNPTHVLYNGVAHAIDPEPFLLGVSIPEGRRGLNLDGETAGISRYHCSIYRVDGHIVVEDHSKHGSFLNDRRILDKVPLSVGDRLRLGRPGVELQLIEVRD